MINKTAITLIFKQYPVLLPDAMKVFSVCNKNEVDALELYTLINADPVLTAISYGLYHEFFPVVQKEFFGIPHIITVLGVNTVKNFILGAVQRRLASPELNINLTLHKNFLRHSLSTAIISYMLARERGVNDCELKEYYCAGLLHRLGDFIISDGSGAEFNVPRKSISREDAGMLAAEIWGFPLAPAVSVSYLRNSEYDRTSGSIFAINAALADYMAAEWERAACPRTFNMHEIHEFFTRLNLPENIFEKIKTPLMAEFRKMEIFLGLEAA
ncbi:MAG: HDOD domain-containing protein [Spirochaetaceae bacterium]|jgi:hypothetical protein|nr:HDOD domain-containing protein [Spirochaetaceae bacterium]